MFCGFFFHVRSAITIGAGCIGAPLVLADYKEDDCVLCASPIFMLIAYYLGFTNRKRKYHEEKTTATLKSKQTSIAPVRRHLLSVVSLPTPLIFLYPLPLKGLSHKDPHSFPRPRNWSHKKSSLKVHKIENFFGFEFEFYTISLLFMLKY